MCFALTPPFQRPELSFLSRYDWRLNELGLKYRMLREVENVYKFSLTT